MRFRHAVQDVEHSELFKNFLAEHKDYYLSSIFLMQDPHDDLQVTFYSPSEDKVASFTVMPVKLLAIDDSFKKDGPIKPLDMSLVSISLKKALETAEGLRKEKYSGELVTKTIVILQHLNTLLYNVTLVTQSFNILNIRIDALTGEILKSDLQSILGLGKPL